MDPSSSWQIKFGRAREHLAALSRIVDDYRALKPISVTPELTDREGVLAYRLRYRLPVPTSIPATIGDILNNLRSSLESLAHEIARRSQGRTLTPEQEAATTFPICETPEQFERFFTNTRVRSRVGLYDDQAQEAFRLVQPFAPLVQMEDAGVTPARSYAEYFKWDELHRLDTLWNIDKHRRVTDLLWRPASIFLWWGSNDASKRVAHRGDGTLADGSVLCYIEGVDEGMGTELNYEFNLAFPDDPALQGSDGANDDAVELLELWAARISTWVFPVIFTVMSRPSPAGD